MANYVWSPFPNMNTSGLQLTNKVDGIRNLSKMKNTDILYIFAHHNRFLPHIGDHEGNKMNEYELCDALMAANLSKAHGCLKLWVCYAGLGMEQKQGFGYRFWYLMHTMYGYHNLTVFAYTEATLDPIFDKHKTCYSIDAQGHPDQCLGRAKEFRVGIRPTGEFIPRGAS